MTSERFELLCVASLAGILCMATVSNAQSLTAMFKLQPGDICCNSSRVTASFYGQATRPSCINQCVMARADFWAVQVLPRTAGLMDCECARPNQGCVGGRSNCERWDLQSVNGVSFSVGSGSPGPGSFGNGSYNGSSPGSWLTFGCEGATNAWYPVVNMTKCLFRKDDASRSASDVTTGTACPVGSQVFSLRGADTELLLAKYLNYLSSQGIPSSPTWVMDYRPAAPIPCAVVANNATTVTAQGSCPSPGSLAGAVFPICEKTLFFAGANQSDILVVNYGSNNITWFHFNGTQVQRNETCVGSELAQIKSADIFTRLKGVILSKGWSELKIWIGRSLFEGYVASITGITGDCLALNITDSNSGLNGSVVQVSCDSLQFQLCMVQSNPMPGSGPSTPAVSHPMWLQAPFCPLPALTPPDAQSVKTVGTLCFFYTSNVYTMSTPPVGVCGNEAAGDFVPAQINFDYQMTRNYVSSLTSLMPGWEAWLWNNSWSFSNDTINGQPIIFTGMVGAPSAYYVNSSGIPFRGNTNHTKSVVCRSKAEVCNSSQGYLGFASSTNSCVSVETGMPANYNQSAANCAAKPGGGASLLRVDNADKFNQIRDLLAYNGNLHQLFWFNGAPLPDGNCNTLRVQWGNSNLGESLLVKSCSDVQHYLCEKPYSG